MIKSGIIIVEGWKLQEKKKKKRMLLPTVIILVNDPTDHQT